MIKSSPGLLLSPLCSCQKNQFSQVGKKELGSNSTEKKNNNNGIFQKSFWQYLCCVNIPPAQIDKLVASPLCLNHSKWNLGLGPHGGLRIRVYVDSAGPKSVEAGKSLFETDSFLCVNQNQLHAFLRSLFLCQSVSGVSSHGEGMLTPEQCLPDTTGHNTD